MTTSPQWTNAESSDTQPSDTQPSDTQPSGIQVPRSASSHDPWSGLPVEGVDVPPVWTTVATGRLRRGGAAPVTVRRVVLQVAAAAAVVLLLVGLLGVFVVRRIAEREAVNGASQLTDQLARTVVMPALEEGLLDGDAPARERFDTVVHARVLGSMFVRVKVWSPDGTILYSDAPALVGERYQLGSEEREVLSAPATVAEVSDLAKPENRLERGQGKMLEVYRPVWTPSGRPVLFETYARYDTVTARTGDLWRGFGGIVVSSLLLFMVLLLPLIWALLDRLRGAQQQRELLLQHAIDASEDERRRIAGDLHDGVVQELVAASLAVAASAENAAAGGDPGLADRLRASAAAVRGSVGGLRTLLVDIYPPNLHSAGLTAALDDLGDVLRGRGVAVTVDVGPDVPDPMDEGSERLIYRIAQECLRNTAKHARATQAELTLGREGSWIVLEIADDGIGLDRDAADRAAREGHLGLRLLADLADEHGSPLKLATSPGQGTRWRLEVPLR
jgi:signal transduction histidine kinase